MTNKCKCHKCDREYPGALFVTCPFCYASEHDDTTARLRKALSDLVNEPASYTQQAAIEALNR